MASLVIEESDDYPVADVDAHMAGRLAFLHTDDLPLDLIARAEPHFLSSPFSVKRFYIHGLYTTVIPSTD